MKATTILTYIDRNEREVQTQVATKSIVAVKLPTKKGDLHEVHVQGAKEIFYASSNPFLDVE